MDQLVLDLTQASLWIQVPVLLAVLMPAAGIGAVLLIGVVDRVAYLFRRLRGRGTAAVSQKPQ